MAVQDMEAARMETADLRTACSRLEAEVAYLHGALAGVCSSLRVSLPARPQARPPCQLPAVSPGCWNVRGAHDAWFLDGQMFRQGECLRCTWESGSVRSPVWTDGFRLHDLPCCMQGSLPAPGPERAGGDATGGGAPQMFIVGGHDSANWLDSTDVFRPAAGGGSWATLAPQGYPRSFSAAAMLGSGLYVVGGGNGEAWFDSVLRCAGTGTTLLPYGVWSML